MSRINPNIEKVLNALIRTDIEFSIETICSVFNVTESQAIDSLYLADIYKQQHGILTNDKTAPKSVILT